MKVITLVIRNPSLKNYLLDLIPYNIKHVNITHTVKFSKDVTFIYWF